MSIIAKSVGGMKSVDPPKKSVSLDVEIEHSEHSESPLHDHIIDALSDIVDANDHQNGDDGAGGSSNHGISDEVNPLVKVDPTYRHRPLSPTPVQSHDYHSDHTEHTIIQPLKTSSYSHLIVPQHSLNAAQNITDHKHFYEYVESIVYRHVNQSNSTINHHHPINITSIKRALSKLKLLLLQPESDTIVVFSDDEEHGLNLQHSSHSIPLKQKSSFETEIHMQAIDEKNNVNLDKQINPQRQKWCTHSTRSLWNVFIPSSALLHHPLYSIDVTKHCTILRGSVRQDWNTIETDDDEERNWEELKPHWFELFFDLMFVAAIVHISSEVADAYHYHENMFIITVFPQFGLLVLCWLEQVLYQSRFRMTQTIDGVWRFFYMALVLMMGLSIGRTNNQTTQKLFLLSYMFTKLIMMMMFIKAAMIPRAKNHSIYMMVENVISIIVVVCIEIFVNVPANVYKERQWVWALIYVILFVYSWFYMVVLVYAKCIRDLGVNIPINVPHIAERMGAFVLIILGETIISIMVQHVESTRDGILTAYTVTMSFFLIVYCIGKLYFESQPTEYELHHHRKVHALSKSVWRARIYKWFHIALFFGLLGLGLGSKITIHELPDYHGNDMIFVFLPGISCVVTCICINVIRLTHPFDYSDKHPHLVCGVWITRILCIAAMIGVLFTWEILNHGIILAIYVVCFLVQIFVDFEAKHRLIITKNEEKDKSLGYYKSPKHANPITYRQSVDIGDDHDDIDHINGDNNKYHDDHHHDHNGHHHHDHKFDDDHHHEDSHYTRREITVTKELSFIGAF